MSLAPAGNGSFTVWISPLDKGDHDTINISLQIIATSMRTIAAPEISEYSKAA